MTNFQKVKKFMETFGQEVKSKPSFSSEKINELRFNLIKEELDEFKQALKDNDLLEVADALTDILYVTYNISVKASAASKRSLLSSACLNSSNSSLIKLYLSSLIFSELKDGLDFTSWPKVSINFFTFWKFVILLL